MSDWYVEELKGRIRLNEAEMYELRRDFNRLRTACPTEKDMEALVGALTALSKKVQELTRRLDSFQDEYGKAPSVSLLMRRVEALENRSNSLTGTLDELDWRSEGNKKWIAAVRAAMDEKRPEAAVRKNVRCYQCGGCTAPVVVYQKIYICEACLKRGLELLAARPKEEPAEPRVDETVMGDPDDERRVAHTFLSDGKWISTVFVPDGLSGGPYETMVFPSREDLCELDCARYATYEEAVVGHEAMVVKWKAEIPSKAETIPETIPGRKSPES